MVTDSEPVKLWRDKFHLNLSASWKADVDKTIKNLALWEEILSNWYYIKNGKKIKKSPGIKPLLDEYERIAMDRIGEDSHPVIVQTRSGERLSERRGSNVSQMSGDTTSLYFRTR